MLYDYFSFNNNLNGYFNLINDIYVMLNWSSAPFANFLAGIYSYEIESLSKIIICYKCSTYQVSHLLKFCRNVECKSNLIHIAAISHCGTINSLSAWKLVNKTL